MNFIWLSIWYDVLLQTLLQYKDAQNETDILMSALAAMQDKNHHLETSLSSETRLKLDLFSALGDAKRQIEIHRGKKQQTVWLLTHECKAADQIYNVHEIAPRQLCFLVC